MNVLRIASGTRFGKLTFIKATGERRNNWQMGLFSCDCGKEHLARISRVKNGYTRSCGCLAGHHPGTHGMRHSPEYASWGAMRTRCKNPLAKDYPRYGGRGINVCEEWESFEAFYAHLGPRPVGTTLDRIDGTRGYEPGNVRWATPKQQANNRRKHAHS